MTWLYCLATALSVGYVAWHWGRAAAPRDPHALLVLLGKEEPADPLSSMGHAERERVATLEDALVKAGWRHELWISDSEHHDEAGRYLWWGD